MSTQDATLAVEVWRGAATGSFQTFDVPRRQNQTILDVVTDPEVPPLPPHVTFTQARDISHAIAHGDPAAPRFMKQSLRAKLAELLTR